MATKKRQKQLKKMKQRKQRSLRNQFVLMPEDPKVDIPSINYAAWMRAIAEKDTSVFDAVCQYLMHFEQHHYLRFGYRALKSICEFVSAVYAVMASDLVPNRPQEINMLQASHMFAHLVDMSGYQTNDGVLQNLMTKENNVAKVLFLMNSHGAFQIDQEKLFAANPYLSSLWYNMYVLGVGATTKTIQRNIYRHLEKMDERWMVPNHFLSGVYFTCTYHNPEAALRVKSIMNRAIKKGNLPEIKNTPREGSVAIITNKWHRNHAVYKSASPLVEQLVGNYDLTLVWTGDPAELPSTQVTDYFDKVCYCYFDKQGNFIIPDEVKDNDFQFIYFPDIGMTNESIWLSNLRIAPIQAVGYGHPDTTGADNEIDYFVGGQVEKDSTDQYAETMVLLPGLAQEPAWPTAERKHNYKDDGIVRVNCVWGPDKYNYTLLTILAEINNVVWGENKESKHEFHFFCSPGVNRYAAVPSFIANVTAMLPNVVVHAEQEYYDYMENAEQHDFSMNSFPFGCYNVLVESLYMGLPFTTLVGDRFYNRAGMWLNEQIGMPYNNFDNPREWINATAKLILDPDELKRQREHLASIDLKDSLFRLEDQHFLEAVKYMIDNHPFTETKLIGV